MKKFKLFFLALLIKGFLFGEEIYVYLKNEYKKEDGNLINERRLEVENLKINYKVIFDNESKKPIIKKWGDFFLGCEFGRRGNGGWDIWNFLSVRVGKDGKLIDLVREYLIKNIYILEKNNERVVSEIYWEGETQLSVKILKYKNIKNWFFMEIESSIPIEGISLSAYPGETTGPPERERWCKFKSGSYNLYQGEGKMKEGDFYVILFNKYGGYQDRYGNFLIFLPEEVSDCKVRGTYGVTIEIIPKKNLKRIKFGIGYFYDKERDDEIENFESKEAKEIYERILSINWEPSFDFSSFKNIIGEIELLSKKDEIKNIIEEYGYKKLKEDGETYIENGDYRRVFDIVEKLEELKEKIYQNLLSSFL